MSTGNYSLKQALLLVSLALSPGIGLPPVYGQSPTGIIEGTVTDESGAVVPNAPVTITNKATAIPRTVTANRMGLYSAPALAPGDYEVRAAVPNFRTVVRDSEVTAGGDTQVDFVLPVGPVSEVVNVASAPADINYESNAVQGTIDRATIQSLPLNGRSFMQLAPLEPGVTITPGSTAQYNTLFTVSVLGGGYRTVFTVDGGNVSDNADTAGGMSAMNFSQDMVQEFQLSSASFDLSTSISTGGAINVVSRSGGNDFHGSGYFFFRDHNIAAYPNLVRSGQDPDPFFARRNPGLWLGGPIKKNKLFFFGNFEYFNQVEAVSISTTAASFAALTGNYPSPYRAKQASFRADYHLNDRNNVFLRYSHDGNTGFGQSLEFGDPSNWVHNINWADQAIAGLTTTLTPALVNDLRVQYNYWSNRNAAAASSDCAAPCVAGSLPNIYAFIGTNFPSIGPNFNTPQGRNSRRYELVESLSWQKGSHRIRVGGDVNRTGIAGMWAFCTPMCVGAWSAEALNSYFGPYTPFLFPFVPAALKSDADALNLPVFNTTSSIFSGIGVGSASAPGPYDSDSGKASSQNRIFIQDTWKVNSRLTVNYGLAWNAQMGLYNSNLRKPQYLAPILGNQLAPTPNNMKEFQPAVGFAWSPFKDHKTVIRGGGAIYWDSAPAYYKLREEPVIGPPGDGRSTLAASAFTNIYPGIVNEFTQLPVAIGAALPIGAALMNMSVGQFASLVKQELPAISAKLAPANPQTSGAYSVSGIDLAKQGVEIFPQNFPLARSYQTNIGVQREMRWGLLLTADWVRKQGENVSLGEVDRNLFNRYLGSATPVPVIPLCTPNQFYVPGQECSTGPVTFWADDGRSMYNGLLVKVRKRYANRTFLQASYALQRGHSQTVWNDTNFASGYGEYLAHQNLNVAGYVDLPGGLQLGFNSSWITATPTTVLVSNLDLPGTVPDGATEPLPGLAYGCVNAACSRQDIINAVNTFNATWVGKPDAKGFPITGVALPPNFSTGKAFVSQDVRLTKMLKYRERYTLALSADVFNLLNISNLTPPSMTLDAAGTAGNFAFGQFTGRVGQSLGSGGPRAFQFGGRLSF